MKRIFVLLIVLSIAIASAMSTFGCNKKPNNSGSTKSKEYRVYEAYVAYADASGIAPLSYEEWLASLKGEKGDKGDIGEKGNNGQDGKDGQDGSQGADGKSAYDLAVENGFTGTVQEWLESLKGEKGQDGSDGKGIVSIVKTATNGNIDIYTITFTDNSTTTFTIINGVDGQQGIQGEKGEKGDKGDTGEKGNNGQDGKDGQDGSQGASGKSAYDLAVENGFTGTLEEWLNQKYESLAYRLNEDKQSYSVVGIGTISDREIVIPDTYNNLPVTEIAPGAFANFVYAIALDNHDYDPLFLMATKGTHIQIDKVILGKNITKIGASAFVCSSVKEIVFNNTLERIEDYAFTYTYNLNTTTLPTSLEYVGNYAFGGSALRYITVNSTNVFVEENALEECYNILNIKITGKINFNLTDMFRLDMPKLVHLENNNCTTLAVAIGKLLPDKVKNLGLEMREDGNFENMLTTDENGVSTLTIGDKVYLIDYSGNEEEVDLSSYTNITHIYPNAFYKNTTLKKITLPSSITEIDDYAFSHCEMLCEVVADWDNIIEGKSIFTGTKDDIIKTNNLT